MIRTSGCCGACFECTKRKSASRNANGLMLPYRCVQYDVWGLDGTARRIDKDRGEEVDLLDSVTGSQDVDPVADIERVLNEQEYDAC